MMAGSGRSASRREWIPGFVGLYSVSANGEIFSHHFLTPRKISKAGTDKDGHPVVSPKPKNGKRKTYSLHRLVCRAFHGEPTVLHNEVAHLDGSRTNCCADNLKWVSHVENETQKRAHGTSQRGAGNPNAKLSEADVRAIRSRVASGEQATAISRDFPVGRHGIQKIIEGRNWRHVR